VPIIRLCDGAELKVAAARAETVCRGRLSAISLNEAMGCSAVNCRESAEPHIPRFVLEPAILLHDIRDCPTGNAQCNKSKLDPGLNVTGYSDPTCEPSETWDVRIRSFASLVIICKYESFCRPLTIPALSVRLTISTGGYAIGRLSCLQIRFDVNHLSNDCSPLQRTRMGRTVMV
jgi:hypothetical protein